FDKIAVEYDLNPTSGDVASSSDCPTPANFFPNQMYDSPANCMGKSELDLWNVEAVAFRLITAQSHCIYKNAQWCPPIVRREGAQPYKFGNLAVHVVTLLDTIQQLQLVPRECFELQQPLKELMIPHASNVTFEYATSFEQEWHPSLEWFEDVFLPTTAAAFSCGFTDADKQEDPNMLSNDIRKAFPSNTTVRQVWRLMKGYLRSPQKQREKVNRQQDFDILLYVPFMPVESSRRYLQKSMQTGYPTYMGPSVWFLWHTIAAPFADFEQSYWQDLPEAAKTTIMRDDAPSSESNIYPLEYLFVGGPNLEDKLSTVVNGSTLMLFFWKIHNLNIQWSAGHKSRMKTERSNIFSVTNGAKKRSTARNLGRAWPTASRFEFWLKDGPEAFVIARHDMEEAHTEINELDRKSGSSLRVDLWTNGAEKSVDDDAMKAVIEAIDKLDQAVLNTKLLYSEYALENTPQCQHFGDAMDSFVALDAPLPLVDGNFPGTPVFFFD
ncbi:hypothetical protein ACHAWF_010444, partial [Thalassiosira exigua]